MRKPDFVVVGPGKTETGLPSYRVVGPKTETGLPSYRVVGPGKTETGLPSYRS